MDILHELETAEKWARINSYIYFFYFIFSILGILFGLVLLIKAPFAGILVMLISGGFAAVLWFFRKAFIQYHKAALQAQQSLSTQSIDEVCHYQRNIFIVYGSIYIIAMLMVFIGVFL